MKLVSIQIENMHNVLKHKYTINNMTYFYGRNGAGKTTVLQAIQLALLGYIPGTSKTNEAIFRHANGHSMTVSAVLDDDGQKVVVTRSWTKNGQRVMSGTTIEPEGYDLAARLSTLELPIFNFNTFMSQSANKLKDWFIEFLPGGSDELDWNKLLRSSLDTFEESDRIILPDDDNLIPLLVEQSKAAGSGIESVRYMNTLFKGQLSAVETRIKDAEGTLRTLVHYDDIEDVSSEEDLEPMLLKIRELRADRDKVIQYNAVVASNQQVENILQQYTDLAESIEYDSNYMKMQADLSTANTELHQSEVEWQNLQKEVLHMQDDIKRNEEFVKTSGICPYTNGACDTIVDEIKNTESLLEKQHRKFDQLYKKYTKSAEARQSKQSEIFTLQQAINGLTVRYSKRDSLRDSIRPVDESMAYFDISVIDQQIGSLEETIEKLRVNLKYNQIAESITVTKYRDTQDQLALKRFIKLTDANHLQNSLTIAPFARLAEQMEQYIQPMFGEDQITVKFLLSEKSNSFSFGIVRGDAYIPFDLLSSGEKCIFTLGLMACLVDVSGSDLKMILVDDLLDHVDSDRIQPLFIALQKLEGIQVILAGVQSCSIQTKDKVVVEIK